MGEVRKLRDDDGGDVGAADVPFSTEAEESVIGACLIDARAVDSAFEIVGAEDFFRPQHRAMAAALGELRDAGDPIDLTTLVAKLQERNELAMVGGAGGIAEIIERVPTAANAVAYARTVRRLAYRRRLIAETRQLLVEMQNSGQPVDEYAPHRLTGMIDLAVEASVQREKLSATLARVATDIEAKQAGQLEPAIPTGLRDLDHLTGGIRLGHFVVIGGLSSHGKTSVATQVVEGALARGVGVGIVSADTKRDELIQRILGQRTGLEAAKIRDGRLEPEDISDVHRALDMLDKQHIEIVDREYDWTKLKVSIRRMIANGIKILIVDHLTLLTNRPAKGWIDNWEQMAGINRDLQEVASQGIAVVLLVQVNIKTEKRDKKGYRPTPGDLKGTGTSYENADDVWLVYWPLKHAPEDPVDDCYTYEINVEKQKMGNTGRVTLRWHPPSMRLHDWFDGNRGLFGS